jgi:hypothetical protein
MNYTIETNLSLYTLPSYFVLFFSENLTVPSFTAKSVKSDPCSIPSPGQYLLPFCLIIILPGIAFCPPKSFTPSLLAFESLPLLVDH